MRKLLVYLSCLSFVCHGLAESNVVVRVMAANTTTGNYQRYEAPGLNIFKGLKPDIVAVQEFNYAGSYRDMVDNAFGAGFEYFRESGYSIPNGIISRYPILGCGSWVDSDTGVNDRGFVWARIDVPGTNDLYVVSVHLKASSDSASRRAAQALEIKNLVAANFPPDAWLVVAGDMNIYSESEGAVATFSSFLRDDPVPADRNGNTGTNASRSKRYDRVLFSPALAGRLVPVEMPSRTYADGLVFDSRVYVPLSDVPPVASGDSAAVNMQHMAVVRDFVFTVPSAGPLPAVLAQPGYAEGQFRFSVTGTTGSSYVVHASTNLQAAGWFPVQTNTAPFTFSEAAPAGSCRRFYRGVPSP